VVRRSTSAGIDVGVQIDSELPDRIEANRFLPQIPNDPVASHIGVSLAAGATAMVRGNDIAGRATGIYSDSRVAHVYGNTIHGNAVGMSSRPGVLGPDNAPAGNGVHLQNSADGVTIQNNILYAESGYAL
jgi:nitrous oxidase accessory protein NosD